MVHLPRHRNRFQTNNLKYIIGRIDAEINSMFETTSTYGSETSSAEIDLNLVLPLIILSFNSLEQARKKAAG